MDVNYTIFRMSDEVCNNADNIDWMNDDEVFMQCIAFDSSFLSPKKESGEWEPNKKYTWSWWLARSKGGEWKLMTWGY